MQNEMDYIVFTCIISLHVVQSQRCVGSGARRMFLGVLLCKGETETVLSLVQDEDGAAG